MSSKILLSFLGGCLALLLVSGITNNKADAQVAVSGVTEEPSGQIIVPFDERELSGQASGIGRDTHFQLTNTSSTSPVNIHVQLLYSGSAEAGGGCSELDFFDTLTPEDTHVYELDNLFLNDDTGQPPFDGTSRTQYGAVVITPVVGASDPVPVAFNHLHATVAWGTSASGEGLDPLDSTYVFNAFGRDAINLASGAKAADGTVLDGVAAGFQRVIPNDMIFQYTSKPFGGLPVFSDLVFIALSDDYFGGDNYKAVGGSTSLFSVEHVVDNDENSFSCGDVQFSCVEIYGINDNIIATEDFFADSNDNLICAEPQLAYDEGFDVLVARPGAEADAIFGVVGLTSSNAGGADHMFVE